MTSIRNYQGEIRLCSTCGQPCHYEVITGEAAAWWHFDEQWDGIWCDTFPMAEPAGLQRWSSESLESLKDRYQG